MTEPDAGPDPRPNPGERRPVADVGETRRLAQPPSARYAASGPGSAGRSSQLSLTGALARAALVAVAGAIVLTVVGAILTSTAGLLFVAGVTGAAIGLVMSSATDPASNGARLTGGPASAARTERRRVAWLSVAVSLGAVVVAAVATWLIGRAEGGVLGPLDYLLETFGPFVPGEALLAALGAWWGVSTGPLQR